MARIRAAWRPSWLPLAVAVLCGVAFMIELVPFARLWFDEHHDGLMLKEALDVYSGAIPYRDSFNQYGFLPSVLEALLMVVLGRTLLTVKLAAVIALAFTAGLLVLVFRRAMPLVAAVGAVVIWMVAQPEVSGLSLVFLPWPSYFALAFIAAATLCHLRSLDTGRRSAEWAAASGALAVASICCRLSVGVLFAAALLVSYLTRCMYGERVERALTAFVFGVLVAGGIVIVTMLGLGALTPMIQQTILEPQAYFGQIGPLTFFAHVLPPATSWLIAVALCCLALRWLLGQLAARFGEPSARALGYGLVVALPACAVLVTQTGWVTVPTANWWPTSIVPSDPQWLSWSAIFVASGLLAVLLAAEACLKALVSLALGIRRIRPSLPPVVTTIAIIGSAGIAQFYPVFEARHIYYSCMPALGLLVWAMLRVAGPRPLAAIAVLLVVTAVPAAASISGAVDKLDVPHARLPGFPVLSGLVENPDDVPYTPILAALKRAYAARPDAPIINIGLDGLWGSLGRNMANPDAYFVTWPCSVNLASDASFINRYRPFIWWEGGGVGDVTAYASRIGYRVVATASPITSWALPVYLLLPGSRTNSRVSPSATVPAGSVATAAEAGCPS